MTATPDGHSPKTDSSAGPDEPPARLSRRKLWLFRIIAATVVPMVLLGLLELGLRIAGYGYPTSLFVEVPDEGLYTTNMSFSLRFFPHSISRPPWPAYMQTDKPAGTYRIFVMGGSAAQGVPDPAYGMGPILQAMLTETYPDANFEVVLAAITAINSHVVLPIARNCAAYEPDLFVVYLGNNEVIGPFGPGTVFREFTANLKFIRAYLASQTTRIGQLATDLRGKLSGKEPPAEWTGMAMFVNNLVSADDERLAVVRSHFAQNLRDICRAGREAGADTILSTVAVNLLDCPPFASTHRAGLTDAELARWDLAFQAGVALDEAGDRADAISQYLIAEEIDGLYAELQFRLGRCYLAVHEPGLARYAFARARDLDALRFRADSDINNVIRAVASTEAEGVYLVDAERAMAKSDKSPAMLPGEELFFEHVHMTFDGNYEVARAIFRQVVPLLPEAIRSQNASPTPPTRQRCAELMDLTAREQAKMFAVVLGMTEGSPFTEQIGHAERRASLEARRKRFASQVGGADPDQPR